jgi:hypothetical protein
MVELGEMGTLERNRCLVAASAGVAVRQESKGPRLGPRRLTPRLLGGLTQTSIGGDPSGAERHPRVGSGPRLRHPAYAGGWKKFEPLWDLLIRSNQVLQALPVLETILSGLGSRPPMAPPGELLRPGPQEALPTLETVCQPPAELAVRIPRVAGRPYQNRRRVRCATPGTPNSPSTAKQRTAAMIASSVPPTCHAIPTATAARISSNMERSHVHHGLES